LQSLSAPRLGYRQLKLNNDIVIELQMGARMKALSGMIRLPGTAPSRLQVIRRSPVRLVEVIGALPTKSL